MKGGEVFVKKVPSMRIIDLASALAPECKLKTVGIRPGEKLHESMVSEEESLVTYQYPDFFVIEPQIKMWEAGTNLKYDGVEGKLVEQGFSYTSENNTEWLEVKDILKLVDETSIVSH